MSASRTSERSEWVGRVSRAEPTKPVLWVQRTLSVISSRCFICYCPQLAGMRRFRQGHTHGTTGSNSADHAVRSLNTAVLLGVGFITGKLYWHFGQGSASVFCSWPRS